jgi:hypothetical protein
MKLKNKILTFKFDATLICILALFVLLCLITINKFGIWHDESYSATLIELPFSELFRRTGLDVHPPLYYLVLKVWVIIFGDSVAAMRMLSLACATGAITVYWSILDRHFNRRVANAGALGISLGAFTLRYAQEIRMYGMGMLIVAVLLRYLLSIKNLNKINQRQIVTLSIMQCVCMLTHYFLGLILPVIILWHVSNNYIAQRKNGRLSLGKILNTQLVLSSILGAVLFVVIWGTKLKYQLDTVNSGFWIQKFDLHSPLTYFMNTFLYHNYWEFDGWRALGVCIVSTVILYSIYQGYKNMYKINSSATRLLAMSIVVPFCLLVLLSMPPLQPTFHPRYLSFYAPIMYLFLGVGIANILPIFNQKKSNLASIATSAFAGTCIGMLVFFVGVSSQITIGNNLGWSPLPYFTSKDINRYILENSDASSVSLVGMSPWVFMDIHVTIGRDIRNYYFAPGPIANSGNLSGIYNRPDILLKDFDDITTPYFWLVIEYNVASPSISSDWQMIQSRTIGYARAELYQKVTNTR